MEEVLDLYELPYNPKEPVVCVDERPCQLLGEYYAPLPVRVGHARKQDYHYQRNGTCSIFAGVEPLAGDRLLRVRPRHTKVDFACFLEHLDEKYPDADLIHLVIDNLSTHTKGALYEVFPAPKARRLAKRFQFHHTPIKASWLNMAEIELSALSRRCLKQRTASIALLKQEVRAFERQRNKDKIKITWRFTSEKAREKMNRHYQDVIKTNINVTRH